jgi:hypothetical protein
MYRHAHSRQDGMGRKLKQRFEKQKQRREVETSVLR